MFNTSILGLIIEVGRGASPQTINAPFIANTPTAFTPSSYKLINAPFVTTGGGTVVKSPSIILLTSGKLAVKAGGIVYIPL